MPWDPSKLDQPLKADKGQRGGSCNRRACQAPGANYYNRGSYAFYCQSCAVELNRANAGAFLSCEAAKDGRPMCIRVEPDDPTNYHVMVSR